TGNFRKKTRRQGSAQLLLIAEDAPIDGARQRKRLPCPGHSDVNEATFLFDSFFFGNGPAVRANALFHARKEHMIEFQALGAVQGNASPARPGAVSKTKFSTAAQMDIPSTRAVSRSTSTVVLPMPRGGTFNTRSSEMSSSGCIARRT